MNGKLAFLLLGAALSAQPPADSRAAPDFEASVRAAMAPSIAQQRAAIQKQASSTLSAVARIAPRGPGGSFFITPFSGAPAGTADCDPLPSEQLDALVGTAAETSGVDAHLVRAVIDQESSGRPCALSAKGAQGLMQLMPATADQLDVEDPFDPQQNVQAGAKLLKSLLERYQNDPSLALGAYNAGSGRVDQAGGVPPIPETMDYVTAILGRLGVLTSGPDAAVTPAKNSGWQTTLPSLKDF